MADNFYSRTTGLKNFYAGTTSGSEPNMRQELINTLDGYFPEIAKGTTGLLRTMRRDSANGLSQCECVDPVTCEPDKDRFCPICVKRDSWVPTIHGVKKIQDIIPGEEILAGDGNYHLVRDIHSRLYQGNMVSLWTVGRGNIPLELTCDHKVFIFRPQEKCHHKKNFGKLCNPDACCVGSCTSKNTCFNARTIEVRADEVCPGDYLVLPLSTEQDLAPKSINVDWAHYQASKGRVSHEPPKNISVDSDFVYFLGMYVAEGSGDAPSRKSRTVVFSLCSDEMEIAERLSKIALDKFGVQAVVSFPRPTCIRVDVPCAVLSRWMHEICGRYSDYKKTPEIIWGLCRELQREYLKAFMLGDGHRDVQNWDTVGITSEQLAEEIFILAFINGFFPSIRKRAEYTGKDGQYHNNSWYVQWLNSQQDDPEKQLTKWRDRFKTEDFLFSRVKEVHCKNDTCAVYDLTVDNVHSFVVNGSLVHNCFGEGYMFDETEINFYRTYEGSDAANASKDKLRKPGLINQPFVVFYIRYSAGITKEDKIVEIELENDGSASEPMRRKRIFRIANIWEYRADNGKLEYYKVFCYLDNVKHLNAPSYGE